jgi:hypothetical protein
LGQFNGSRVKSRKVSHAWQHGVRAWRSFTPRRIVRAGQIVKRTRVRSSSIASIGYDPADFVLEIEYRNGRVYRYFDVPPAAHRLLLNASSIGKFVNTVIKPRFPSAPV